MNWPGDIGRMWTATRRAGSLHATPLLEAFAEINRDLAFGREPSLSVIGVFGSMEEALEHNRILKRVRAKRAAQDTENHEHEA